MRLLKFISFVIFITCVIVFSVVPVFATDFYTVPSSAEPYLKDYYIVYVNRFGYERLVTSDNVFYLIDRVGYNDMAYTSDRYTLNQDDIDVYYADGSSWSYQGHTRFHELYYDFDNGLYYSNFDLTKYRSDNDFDVIFYKTVYYLNQFDFTSSLGSLRIDNFVDVVILLVSIGVVILSSFVVVRLIKRIILRFGG